MKCAKLFYYTAQFYIIKYIIAKEQIEQNINSEILISSIGNIFLTCNEAQFPILGETYSYF